MIPRGPRPSKPFWTPAEDERFAVLWAQGKSLEEISGNLPGRSVEALRDRRKRLGLPLRNTCFKPKAPEQKRAQAPRTGKTSLPPLTCLGD